MSPSGPRIIIIDNYDSYAYNLYQAFGELTGRKALVIRNDQVTLAALRAERPTHVVISPGPGSPEDPRYFGVCRSAILELGRTLPVLGVCLGHQGIGHAFGGAVVRAPVPMHGKTSAVEHDGSSLFRSVPRTLTVMRYHSLMIEPSTFPSAELRITAMTADGIIMGVAHRRYPVVGVQFHPESIGTPDGLTLLRNFVEVGAQQGSFADGTVDVAPKAGSRRTDARHMLA